MKIFWIISALLLLNACASTSRTIHNAPTLPIDNPNNEIALDTINSSTSTSASNGDDQNNSSAPALAKVGDREANSGKEPMTKKPEWPSETGIATYYAGQMEGQITASGEPYDSSQLTAAHRTLPIGSQVRVTNAKTKQTVTVRINDRWGGGGNRIINLSKAAASQVGFGTVGMLPVTLTVESIPSGSNQHYSDEKLPPTKQLPSRIADDTSANHPKLRICQNEASILGLTGDFYRYHVSACLGRNK